MTPTKEMIEAAARALYEMELDGVWSLIREDDRRHYFATAEVALEAALAEVWRPIAEAPKDGTVIMVEMPEDISDSDREFYCYPPSRISYGWAWKNGKFRPCGGLSIPVFINPVRFAHMFSSPQVTP